MQDKIVEAVCNDLKQRSELGQKKYGTTLDRDDLDLKEWLQHAYEECLDQANYLKRAIIELDTPIEDILKQHGFNDLYKRYQDIKNINDNMGIIGHA